MGYLANRRLVGLFAPANWYRAVLPDGTIIDDGQAGRSSAIPPGRWFYEPLDSAKRTSRRRRLAYFVGYATLVLAFAQWRSGRISWDNVIWALALGFLFWDPFFILFGGYELGLAGRSWLAQPPGVETQAMLEARLIEAVGQSKLPVRHDWHGTKKGKRARRYHTWKFQNGFTLDMQIPEAQRPAVIELRGHRLATTSEYRSLKGLILANLRFEARPERQEDALVAQVK